MNPSPSLPLRVVFRVDASNVIGIGHVRRCITLARALVQLGAECRFAIRETDIDIDRLLLEFGPTRMLLPKGRDAIPDDYPSWLGAEPAQDASDLAERTNGQVYDWVIADHYAIDAEWHDAVKAQTGAKIAVIDDLANRPLAADLIIDQNWHADHNRKYALANLTKARILAGPSYALLEAAFVDGPKWKLSPEVRSIGVFMGGTDPLNATEQVLDMLDEFNFTGKIAVVTGSGNRNLHSLRQRVLGNASIQLYVDLPDLAYFFAEYDFQIGAGGTATWERCCAGVPTLALVCADNQREILFEMAEAGFQFGAELSDRNAQIELLGAACVNSILRSNMSAKCRQLVDGKGATRIARALASPSVKVRAARFSDALLMYEWRNDIRVRRVSRDSKAMDYNDHLRWLELSLKMSSRLILIGELETGEPIGVVRFDKSGDECVEVSIYLDPARSGQGLGGPLLDAAEKYLADMCNSAVDIVAYTMFGNTASEQLFLRGGYSRTATHFLKQRSR